MSKAVVGDPKVDAEVKKTIEIMEKCFTASGQFKRKKLDNLNTETLRRLMLISAQIQMYSGYYLTIRSEQALGGVKAISVEGLHAGCLLKGKVPEKPKSKNKPKVVTGSPKPVTIIKAPATQI